MHRHIDILRYCSCALLALDISMLPIINVTTGCVSPKVAIVQDQNQYINFNVLFS